MKTQAIVPMGAVKTVNGSDLTVNEAGGRLDITDGKGDVSHVTTANIAASSAVVHLISGVLMPPAS